MKTLFLICVLLLPSIVWGQQKINADINKAQFAWTWAQSTGGPVSFFTLKCGSASGTYTIITQVNDPAARSYPVKNMITANGDYFCVVSASNEFGESANSGELFFGVGVAPLPVGSFGIVVK